MKTLIPLFALTLGLVSTAGCANKNNPAAESSGVNDAVTDVDTAPMPLREAEMTYGAPLDVTPISAAPATPAYEVPVVTQAPAAPVTGAGAYTVKKGDTLFGIARQHYGSGAQWQRIANANPGLTPATLKAGTTIAIP